MKILGEHNPTLPINNIFIPGSHDSAADKLEDKIGVNQGIPQKLELFRPIIRTIIKKWARTQNTTVQQQLEDGIRYLDLRVQWRESKKAFYLLHSLYGPPLQKILDEISLFLHEHPKEVLIIQISDLNHMPGNSHDVLAKLLHKTFGKKIIPQTEGSLPTLSSLQQNGYQVILIYKDSEIAQQYNFLPRSRIVSQWANKAKIEKLKPNLDEYLKQRLPSTYSFFVLQTILSPDTSSILSSLKPFSKSAQSLEDLAKKINPLIPQWIREWNKEYPKKINIVIADFIDKALATEIILFNKDLANK